MTKKNILLLFTLIVLIAAGYYYSVQPNSTLNNAVSDFAIKDTAAIQKIHIADLNGNDVVLERQKNGFWLLNKNHHAKDHAITSLLETLYRLQVQGPVQASMKPRVMKRLATTHRLVEIFTDDLEFPEKTYYIGDATMNHMGTFMLLETKENGKSSDPFIVEDYTTKGFLTPRFHAIFDDWRNTTLFYYPNLDIKRIDVKFLKEENNSFSLFYNGENDIQISNINNELITNIDAVIAKEYLLKYKRINFESYVDNKLTTIEIDSINMQKPDYEIVVTDNNENKKSITLWKKDVGVKQEDFFGNEVNYDVDRMWGKTHLNNFVFAQYYTFDKLLVPVDYFKQD